MTTRTSSARQAKLDRDRRRRDCRDVPRRSSCSTPALILVAAAVAWLVLPRPLVSRRFASPRPRCHRSVHRRPRHRPGDSRTAPSWASSSPSRNALGPSGTAPGRRCSGRIPTTATIRSSPSSTTTATSTRFSTAIERAEPDYPTRARVIRDRVDAMFARGRYLGACRADGSVPRGDPRPAALTTSAGIVDRVLDAPDGDSMTRISFNNEFAVDDGELIIASAQRRCAAWNRHDRAAGRLLSANPPGPPPPPRGALCRLDCWNDRRPVRPWAGTASQLQPCSARSSQSPLALSTGYIDNARYLLGPLALILVGGTLAVRAISLHVAARLTGRAEYDPGRSAPPQHAPGGSTAPRTPSA